MNEYPSTAGRPLREILTGDARELAPLLLGAVLTHESREGPVSVRLTEVEAYLGPEDSLHPDSGVAHLPRPNAPERPHVRSGGAPVRLLHLRHAPLHQYRLRARRRCLRPVAAGGEIVEGGGPCATPAAHVEDAEGFARGPARLAKALGLTTADSGRDALAAPFRLVLPSGPATERWVPVPVAYPAPAVPTSMPGVSGKRATHGFRYKATQPRSRARKPPVSGSAGFHRGLTEMVVEWTVCLRDRGSLSARRRFGPRTEYVAGLYARLEELREEKRRQLSPVRRPVPWDHAKRLRARRVRGTVRRPPGAAGRRPTAWSSAAWTWTPAKNSTSAIGLAAEDLQRLMVDWRAPKPSILPGHRLRPAGCPPAPPPDPAGPRGQSH